MGGLRLTLSLHPDHPNFRPTSRGGLGAIGVRASRLDVLQSLGNQNVGISLGPDRLQPPLIPTTVTIFEIECRWLSVLLLGPEDAIGGALLAARG